MDEEIKKQIQSMSLNLLDIRASQDAMNKRLARVEARLTQLMIYEGMQSDGRTQLQNPQNHVQSNTAHLYRPYSARESND